MTDRLQTSEQKSLAPHWVAFSHTNPRCGEYYWLLDTQGFRMLAHFDNESRWRSFDVHGEPFELVETYTHWTSLREPAVHD